MGRDTLQGAEAAVDAEPQVTQTRIPAAVPHRHVVAPLAQPDIGGRLRGEVDEVPEQDARPEDEAARAQVQPEDGELHLQRQRQAINSAYGLRRQR